LPVSCSSLLLMLSTSAFSSTSSSSSRLVSEINSEIHFPFGNVRCYLRLPLSLSLSLSLTPALGADCIWVARCLTCALCNLHTPLHFAIRILLSYVCMYAHVCVFVNGGCLAVPPWFLTCLFDCVINHCCCFTFVSHFRQINIQLVR